jgi:hypothetical protein
MRCSMRCPWIVWVRMSSHSSASSGPVLLMMLLGRAILPTSCSRPPNSMSRRVASSRPMWSATSSASRPTPWLWRPGVLVVGLDDLAEQERGAPVGASELELVVDQRGPLAPEQRDEPEQRSTRSHAQGWSCAASAARRPSGASTRSRRCAKRSSRSSSSGWVPKARPARSAAVARRAAAARRARQVDRPETQLGPLRPRERDDQHRRQRVPGVGELPDDPLGSERRARRLQRAGQHVPRAHHQRTAGAGSATASARRRAGSAPRSRRPSGTRRGPRP